MKDYSNLQTLIDYLEYGTKLHICICFRGKNGNSKTEIKLDSIFHLSPACNAAKLTSGGMEKCHNRRLAAINKAVEQRAGFGEICPHGIYEYVYPVFKKREAVCVIFIGNIYSEELPFRFKEHDKYLETLERGITEDDCKRSAHLLESYILTLLENCSDVAQDDFDPFIEKVKNYIDDNYTSECDIKTLAKALHYNGKYLGRKFKAKVGKSYSDYVNNKRSHYAAVLFDHTEYTVTEIATKAGFNSVSYFNRVFKKHIGYTPCEFRDRT